MTFAHLADALHELLVGLGGTPRAWRVDRMATAVVSGTDRLNPQFAQLAKHYGTDVRVCPPHRPQRKGVVEAAVKFVGGRWWRTARAASPAEAQASLDAFCRDVADARRRGESTVGELGAAEPLRPLPPQAFPAELTVERVASRSALVAFDGNRYSVGPGHAGRRVLVRCRVGEPHLRIFAAGALVATHRRAPAGAGQTIRHGEHAAALEHAVLAAFTTEPSCQSRKVNRPPGEHALAALAARHGHTPAQAPVVSLDRYAQLAEAS